MKGSIEPYTSRYLEERVCHWDPVVYVYVCICVLRNNAYNYKKCACTFVQRRYWYVCMSVRKNILVYMKACLQINIQRHLEKESRH